MTGQSLSRCQSAMADYLLDTDGLPGDDLLALIAINEDAARERLRIYRNNVLFSLTRAMAEQFPVTQRVVGEAFFMALSRDFILANPPTEPALNFIGADFQDFIRNSPHCRDLPWLADLARLEWLCRHALHAADAGVLGLDVLIQLPPEKLTEVVPEFHPSVVLFKSAYPVVPIWEENLKEAPEVIDMASLPPSTAVIYRRDDQVSVVAVEPGVFAYLACLANGKSLGDALASGSGHGAVTDEELPGLILWLISLGLFSGHHFSLASR